MPTTPAQAAALEAWRAGKNLRITAVPGAGKTHVITKACEAAGTDRRGMVLAYNRALCDATRAKLEQLRLSERVSCHTFHGLATRCVSPAYDDVALHELLDELEAGTSAPAHRFELDFLIIDEAQDMRGSFFALIPHVVCLGEDAQLMLVGDEQQMLYDYDETDAADLKYLRAPAAHFASSRPWESFHFDVTHRCAPCIAEFVSRAFDVDFRSAAPAGGQVRLHTVNMWRNPARLVAPLLEEHLERGTLDRCAILVSHKAHNRPLQAAVNYWSERIPVFVQGVDGQDARIKRGKLFVGTWHSAKGTEFDTVIVFGASERHAARLRNAFFVALTRARRTLVVLNDARDPSHAVLRAADAALRDVSVDAATRAAAAAAPAASSDEDDHNEQAMAGAAAAAADGLREHRAYSVDDWRPSSALRWLTCAYEAAWLGPDEADLDGPEPNEDEIIARGDEHEDVAEVYRIAALMGEELGLTNRVLRWVDIVSPSRVTPVEQTRAICAGRQGRFVSERTPTSSLLPPLARASFERTIAQPALDAADWCGVASACRAWGHYHHQHNRMLRDGFRWADASKLAAARARVRAAVGADVVAGTFQQYDVRFRAVGSDATLYIRADATSTRCAYLFVWKSALTRQDDLRAALVASFHPASRCECHNLRTGGARVVALRGPEHKDAILRTLVAQLDRR